MTPADGGAAEPDAPEPTRVLVVGRSEVTRVVVARIVERAGLRPVSVLPEEADEALSEACPAVVVLDGGADNRDCDGVLAGIEALRRAQGGGAVPAVAMLCNRTGTPQELALPAVVDATVAKPITPERLQPVLEELSARCRR